MDVRIRGFEERDVDDLIEVFQQPKCVYGTLLFPYRSPKEASEGLLATGRDTFKLVAVVEEEGRPRAVGMLELRRGQNRRVHAAALFMLVHDRYQGRGIGTRLVDACLDLAKGWLQITRIELTVFTDNAAAIHLYEKFGFQKEGTMRKYAWRNGEYADVEAMAWLRDD